MPLLVRVLRALARPPSVPARFFLLACYRSDRALKLLHVSAPTLSVADRQGPQRGAENNRHRRACRDRPKAMLLLNLNLQGTTRETVRAQVVGRVYLADSSSVT